MRGPALAGAAACLLAAPGAAAGPAAAPPKKPRPAAKTSISTAAATGLPLLSPPTFPITAEAVLGRLQELDAKLKGLSATFRQSVRLEEAGTVNSVEGTLDFSKPSRLRVEHRLPEPQTVVTDGKALWVWRSATRQAIQSSLQQWLKSEPWLEGLMHFGGYGRLSERYAITVSTISAPGDDGHRRVELELKPRARGSDFTLTLALSTRDYFPSEARLRAGEMVVHSRFEGVRFNPVLADSLFQFTPPPDADVFRNFGPPSTP